MTSGGVADILAGQGLGPGAGLARCGASTRTSAPAPGPDAPAAAAAAASGFLPACGEAGRASSRSGGPEPHGIRSRWAKFSGFIAENSATRGSELRPSATTSSALSRRAKCEGGIAPITTPSGRPTRGILRLSGRARSIVAGLELGDPLKEVMNETTETARVL